MEPPPVWTSETLRDEKVKVLNGIRPLAPRTSCVASSAGYRDEPGVAADSSVETYVALQALRLDSWRWQGVPFYLRAGK